MMKVSDIKRWLNTIRDDASVGVDDGGLCLRVIGDLEVYCEVGGIPDEPIALWWIEQGEEYAVPEIITKDPEIVDMSWHNDVCPSFTLRGHENDDNPPRLWCEHPDENQRETGSNQRYWVSSPTADADVWAGDDPAEAVKQLKQACRRG